MTVEVLGETAGKEAPHHNRRERSVLAALLVMRPTAVSPEVIAEAVWGDAPPSTWAKQIQGSVWRLRTSLGNGSIVTVDRAYRLELPRGAVDVDVFEDEVARAATLASEGEHGRAVVALERALGLWRTSDPYEAVADWPPAAVEIERLTELRRQAEDDLLAERLASGDHRGVAATASALAAAEPLRETRWIALATALYRCERQADALAALRRARAVLRDELGLDPSPALVDLEQAILRQDEDLSVAPALPAPDDRCPYKGLSAYEPGDADVYFGRDADIARAVATLDRMRFLVLAGASGTGKSSLLRAGVQPALTARGTTMVEVSPSGAALEEITRAPAHAVIAIDQFETAFSASLAAGTSREICDALAAHHRGGGGVAIAVRSDHLDACAADPAVGSLVLSSLHLVTPLRADALRAAIEEPARHAHLTLEHGFPDVVLADAEAATGALPLLSHALAETWQRREGSTLTIDGYKASGGLRGAVARSAELLFTNLPVDDRRRCALILRRLVTLTEAGAVVSHPVDSRTLADEDLQRVVGRLVQARLVSAREHHLELAHESLVRAWPRLRGWLEADAEGQRALGHLSTAAATWDSLGRPAADLYRGPRLAIAWDWADRDEDALTPLERTFLVASRDAEEAERAAAEEAERRESRSRARVRTMRRWAVAAAATALVGIAAATVAYRVAESRGTTAREQTDRAHLEAITKDFAAVMGASRDVGFLLAAEAYLRWPDSLAAQGALLTAFATDPGFRGDLHVRYQQVPHTAVTADGLHLVLGFTTGVEVRRLETGAKEVDIATSAAWSWPDAPDVAVSDDGSVAALVAPDSRSGAEERPTLATFDLDQQTELAVTPLDSDAVEPGGLAVSPDGTYVAVVDGRTGDLTVRASATGRDLGTVAVGAQDSRVVESPGAVVFVDDVTVLLTTLDGRILVVDVPSATVTRTLESPARHANTATIVTDDGTVVAAGDDGLLALSLNSGRVLWAHEHVVVAPGACLALAVAPATGRVFCAGEVGVIREYDLATGAPIGQVRAAQNGVVDALAVTPDEATLLSTATRGRVVSRWSLDGTGPITRVVARAHEAVDRWSADGRGLIVARRDPVANAYGATDGYRVWDVASDVAVRDAPADLEDLAWFGEGRVIGLTASTGTRDVYDAATGVQVAADVVPADASALFVSADGTRAYALFDDKTVETYDTSTLQRIGDAIHVIGVPTHVSASAEGALVAITSMLDEGPIVQFLDSRTGRQVGFPNKFVRNAALTSDGTAIAIHDQYVRRFDSDFVQRGETLGSGGLLDALEFSADGTRYLVSARDGSVSLFDTAGAELIGIPLDANSPGATAGFLRPDGLAIAVNVEEGVAVWDVDPAHMYQAACETAGRNLSQQEWDAYLADVGEWRKTCPQYSKPSW
ncbi:nSTAND1 domain-containing NTPase [Demequina maris]|uniref:nSTAND1 domain-containing NTPase n=1 Tax=Demequina maris TaxID=1638982 RepID=UPI000783080E|nr:BTAD domain-containing putative transcriptional regulator [Demequina maris]